MTLTSPSKGSADDFAAGLHRLPRRRFVAALTASVLVLHAAFAQAGANDPQNGGTALMRIRCRFEQQVFTVTLLENPTAREFAAMLPLDLAIEDFSNNEKIAYLPRRLAEQGGGGSFSKEAAGDLCYYVPWGNLAFFHGDYRYSSGSIRLGRLDGGPQPLLTRGKFQLRIEHLSAG
ncbi:cyclophilin-like fold protein [Bradyrhizobium sp. UFLA05-112]